MTRQQDVLALLEREIARHPPDLEVAKKYLARALAPYLAFSLGPAAYTYFFNESSATLFNTNNLDRLHEADIFPMLRLAVDDYAENADNIHGFELLYEKLQLYAKFCQICDKPAHAFQVMYLQLVLLSMVMIKPGYAAQSWYDKFFVAKQGCQAQRNQVQTELANKGNILATKMLEEFPKAKTHGVFAQQDDNNRAYVKDLLKNIKVAQARLFYNPHLPGATKESFVKLTALMDEHCDVSWYNTLTCKG